MSEETSRQKRGPSDATDYSSTKAPETQKDAEERDPQPYDVRLQPGGPLGAPADPGMPSLDRDVAVSGGRSDGLADYGKAPDKEEA
jgi:hypothetical protein